MLFPNHALGQRVIGAPETIEAFTLEEAQRFHTRWYAPNNVTVVIAGNLDPEAVRAAAARTFGALEPRSLPLRSGREVPQIEPQHLTLRVDDAQMTRRSVRYAKLVRLPEETERSRSARLLLSNFLASQLADSPHDVLVEHQGVTDGIAAGVTRHLPGLYQIWLSAEPTPETSPEQLAGAMRGYLEDLVARGGPGLATLERLKRRFAADLTGISWSGERMMGRVVDWVSGGDPYDRLSAFPLEVAATTPDDVTQLLAHLTGSGREVTGFLLPKAAQQGRAP
jgi:zinc protease